MLSKRNFIKSLFITAALPLKLKADRLMNELPPQLTAPQYDDFWEKMRAQYLVKTEYINLENGYYSMMAQPVLEAYLKDLRYINLEASHYLRTVQFDEKNKLVTQHKLKKRRG